MLVSQIFSVHAPCWSRGGSMLVQRRWLWPTLIYYRAFVTRYPANADHNSCCGSMLATVSDARPALRLHRFNMSLTKKNRDRIHPQGTGNLGGLRLSALPLRRGGSPCNSEYIRSWKRNTLTQRCFEIGPLAVYDASPEKKHACWAHTAQNVMWRIKTTWSSRGYVCLTLQAPTMH